MADGPKKNPECVRVVVRCRPMSRKEVEDNRKRIIEMNLELGEITVKNPEADPRELPKPFTFDQVYDWNSEQAYLFETTAQPIVDSVLTGYNGTVFAYGQTGTGKTHTMEGQWEPHEMRGIIPRAFNRIFERIEQTHDQNFLVRASFLEIYNEEVRDLLSKDPKNKLELKEDVDRGVYVKDLTSYVVKKAEEMEHVLMAGKKNRSVGATLMNQDSSRSHSIFSIIIESSNESPDGSKHIRAGKLNLVDLAGSERQSKTGATGDRLKEATKINLSLSALGNVISALVDGKSSHIPYRDSKLTRLLQDSLGGNTKTVMVANLGPADYNYDETISTLRYANRAKNIKNKPKINEDPKDAMLREFQEEISRLKAMLEAQQGGEGGGEIDMAAVAGGGGGGGGGGEGGQDQGLMRQLSNKQLEEANSSIDAQKKALEQAENMREEDKKRAEEEIRQREEALATEQREREALAHQLAMMEEKLVHGTAEEEEAKAREEELLRAQIELEERRAEQQRLADQLAEHEEMTAMVDEKYVSIQEEVAGKTKKLKKLYAKFQEAVQEVKDLQHEFQVEKNDILVTIREQDKEIKKLSLIANNFIPQEEFEKIESRTMWDDVDGAWRILQEQLTGNNVRRPASASGKNRKGSKSNRSEEEEDDGLGLAVPNMPNVYFSYPSSGPAFVDDHAGSERPQSSARPKSRSARTASATKRPTSARKSARDEEKASAKTDLRGGSEGGAETEDFPTARGLVARK
mmetsp:Transcript_48126/g.113987  ORF Transcript_48126/g.113987 Transcript_48126/m.113987 type:complete len:746 (+) Transcript_48126:59-2296(+)